MAREMKKAVEEQYPELAKYLVPKCEAHGGMAFCNEHGSCGRHPMLSEIYSDYEWVKKMAELVAEGVITAEDLDDDFYNTFCAE